MKKKHETLLFYTLFLLLVIPSVAFADGEGTTFAGSAGNLISMLRGMVRLARIVMMFVAALLGIICGVMWYTGQQQAQGMLQKFFVAVFFIFGATAILDAILGMTIGNVSVETKNAEGIIDCNWANDTGCNGDRPFTPTYTSPTNPCTDEMAIQGLC